MSALKLIFLLFMFQTYNPFDKNKLTDASESSASSGNNKLPDCGESFYNSTGEIVSPLYPENSPPSKSCTWKIFAPPENVILLEFQNVTFGGDNATKNKPSDCKKDKLQIFTSNSRNKMKRQATFYGPILQPSVLYKTSAVKIIFTTDHDTLGAGFSIKYHVFPDKCDKFQGNCQHKCITTVEKTRKCVCSDGFVLLSNGLDCFALRHYEIASRYGFIRSPSFPNFYPANSFLTWRIKTTPGHQIQLDFLIFFMETCDDCTCDYLAVYDGSLEDSNHLKTLCGSKSGTKITFSTNELFIIFKSDHSNQNLGFEAKYSAVCGSSWKAKTQEGYIYSHDSFALSDYPNDMVCDWSILGMDGFATKLNLEFLDIEESEDCETDFVEIIDNKSVMEKYCGSDKPMKEFISNENFTIRFRSDDSITGRGFRIKYQAVENRTLGNVTVE